ncbi:hypothetical protein [Rhizobacter sp. SG703]|uniref:hypothetical protein n=1 Tax=Rhizobacter sp. SG703 TaxID=2587140 RepID=UPI001447C300|nr:hypothetical protein [Rhizobacter sp. SG703]NKI95147.1 hypothetical protein [Rhizobacter sp. SG703]
MRAKQSSRWIKIGALVVVGFLVFGGLAYATVFAMVECSSAYESADHWLRHSQIAQRRFEVIASSRLSWTNEARIEEVVGDNGAKGEALFTIAATSTHALTPAQVELRLVKSGSQWTVAQAKVAPRESLCDSACQ